MTGAPHPREEKSEGEARYRALFENSVIGIRISSVAEGGRIVEANPAYCRMLGYTEEEVTKRTIFDLTHPSDLPRTHELYSELTSGRSDSYQIEKRYVRKDGSNFWGHLTVHVLRGPEGRVTHHIGMVEDVDQRQRAEVALRESAELLAAVLNAAVDGIVLIDVRGTIQMVNPAVRKLFGYSEGEILGRNVKMLMPQPWRDEHDGYLSRYRHTGEKRIIGIGRQVEGRRRDGSTFPLDLAVSEVRHGQAVFYLGTLRDITERVRLEGEIRQAQKMEAIGRLAGGVAHDFNTLLGTIRGYSEMMLAELPQGEALSRHAEQIHRAALRGADLTRQLLAFSRRQEIRSQAVDVGSLLADVETMLDRLIGEDIHVVRQIEPDLGRIQGDPGELHQIVLNLVVNARDAMPVGGTLTLSAANVEVENEIAVEGGRLPPGGYVVLAVGDTGTGMPEEVLRRIFEPFFTTKEPGKGTGLGLSTVHAIVRRAKGGIAVESEPGHGTVFRVYLPHAVGPQREADRPGAVPEEPAPSPSAGATLLVVEDDAMFRGLLTQMLLANGFRVLAAANPAQALEIAAGQEGIRLLLSDMVMPGGTGADLAARLRAGSDTLKVILMSGYTDEALSSRDLDRTGADAFLEKPFATAELLRQIRLLLAG